MKKIYVIFLISLCIISFVSCKKEEKEFVTDSIAANQIQQKKPESVEVLTNKKDFPDVLENQEYQMFTDHQYWFSEKLWFADCAETQDSIYFLVDVKLYVFDKNMGTYSILCNNPSCSHEYGTKCNAIIGNGNAHFLEFYNNSLYTLSSDMIKDEESGISKEHLKLYRISLDGSEREEICTLGIAVNPAGARDNIFTVYGMVLHRGYLYYIYSYGTGKTEDSFYNNNSNTLYRIALDKGSEPECICPMEYGGDTAFVSIQGHGSYIYFIKTDKVEEGGSGYLYRFNIETEKLEYIDIGWIDCYQISGNKIIYYRSTEQKYYYCNTDSWENGIFYEPEQDTDMSLGYMVWDGSYYNIDYFSNDKSHIVIYTSDMEKIYEYDKIKNKDGVDLFEFISPDFNIYSSWDEGELYYLKKLHLQENTSDFIKA